MHFTPRDWMAEVVKHVYFEIPWPYCTLHFCLQKTSVCNKVFYNVFYYRDWGKHRKNFLNHSWLRTNYRFNQNCWLHFTFSKTLYKTINVQVLATLAGKTKIIHGRSLPYRSLLYYSWPKILPREGVRVMKASQEVPFTS